MASLVARLPCADANVCRRGRAALLFHPRMPSTQAAAKQQPNRRTGQSLQEQVGQGAEEAPPTLTEVRFSFSGLWMRWRRIRERLPLCY